MERSAARIDPESEIRDDPNRDRQVQKTNLKLFFEKKKGIKLVIDQDHQNVHFILNSMYPIVLLLASFTIKIPAAT